MTKKVEDAPTTTEASVRQCPEAFAYGATSRFTARIAGFRKRVTPLEIERVELADVRDGQGQKLTDDLWFPFDERFSELRPNDVISFDSHAVMCSKNYDGDRDYEREEIEGGFLVNRTHTHQLSIPTNVEMIACETAEQRTARIGDSYDRALRIFHEDLHAYIEQHGYVASEDALSEFEEEFGSLRERGRSYAGHADILAAWDSKLCALLNALRGQGT